MQYSSGKEWQNLFEVFKTFSGADKLTFSRKYWNLRAQGMGSVQALRTVVEPAQVAGRYSIPTMTQDEYEAIIADQDAYQALKEA